MTLQRFAGWAAVATVVGALVLVGGLAAVSVADSGSWGDGPPLAETVANETPTEDAYVEPVPEPGDPYFEAEASDGSWVSYVNPRDEYRNPYVGDGSGKLCVTVLNEEGEVVVGESVPNTSITIPTGESLEWHTDADPMVVEFPLTDHYERPLDADQFGTSPEVVQGDGYLDAHCIEWHGLPDDGTVEYGEPRIEGEHADRIELVGYVQQAHDAWDSDVDPIADAESYEQAGGGWTYQTEASHGQVVVVFQLDPSADSTIGGDEDDGERNRTDGGEDTNGTHDRTGGNDAADDSSLDGDRWLQVGVAATLVALLGVHLAVRRR